MSRQVTLENIKDISLKLRVFFQIGNIILLNGPMGAGKTTLLKEILHEYPVGSPSFLHALTYGNSFIHIDAYTLSKENFINLDLENSLIDKCVIIEWGNLVADVVSNFLNPVIIIDILHEHDDRFISVSGGLI